MERKLLEEIGGLRRDWKEKERDDEADERIRKAREEGVKEGRGEHGGRGGRGGGVGCGNEKGYEASRAIPDLSTQFLAGVGMQSLKNRLRSRSRSRSRDRYRDRSRDRHRERPIYVMERGGEKGRRDDMRDIYGGLGKIEDTVKRIEKRVVDADFEGDLDRVRFGRYARRYC